MSDLPPPAANRVRWPNIEVDDMDTTLSTFDKTIVSENSAVETVAADEIRNRLKLSGVDDIHEYTSMTTIGVGGLGAVFSAREPGLNREVALKILRPEFRNSKNRINGFVREARTTAQIDHPNIVPIHRIGVFDDAGVFFTMKRIEGETLRTVVKKLREGRPEYLRNYTLRRRLEIFISVCQAMAFAHSKRIIHRDLKPANVMIGDYGEVMLMDWGLAYCLDSHQIDDDFQSADTDEKETELLPPNTCVISGTPAFMSPEQAAGRNSEIDERSDIYSLGAILYSLLTLQAAPFDPDQPTEKLLPQVIAGRFQRPRRRAPLQMIPRELEAITMKAMNVSPEKRYQKVQEIIGDVRNYLDYFPVEAYSKSPLYKLRKLCRRRPLIPAVTIMALLTFCGTKAFQQLNDRGKIQSLVELAEYNDTQSENQRYVARRTFNQLRYQPQTSSTIAERRDLRRVFLRQVTDFLSYSSAALECLAGLEQISYDRQYITAMLEKQLAREFQFCMDTDNQDIFRNRLKQLRSRWSSHLAEILARNRRLATQIAMFDNDAGTLHITMPEGFSAAIRNNAPDVAPDKEAWTEITSENTPVKTGSYLLRFTGDKGQQVFYPAAFQAAEYMELKPSGIPVIPEGMVLIPAGEFYRGSANLSSFEQKEQLPAFFISRNEVTIGEYRQFWLTLKESAAREQYIPRRDDGTLLWDKSGVVNPKVNPALPVTGIPPQAAMEYCRYLSAKHGQKYRLPTAMELEKASGGYDKRTYVWGNIPDKNAALVYGNSAAKKYPYGAPGGTFPRDVSCYGVNDLAGNVREFISSGKDVQVYGGSYLTLITEARIGTVSHSEDAEEDVGFRVVMEQPKKNEALF